MAVYMPKGTISKETVETRSYGKKLFYGQIPRIFGNPTYVFNSPCAFSWNKRSDFLQKCTEWKASKKI